jgi:hypothetical protein
VACGVGRANSQEGGGGYETWRSEKGFWFFVITKKHNEEDTGPYENRDAENQYDKAAFADKVHTGK